MTRPTPEDWLERTVGRGFTLSVASADASFRRYLRVHLPGGATRILMDAPPSHEDCRPFVAVARALADAGVHVPGIVAADLAHGYLLLEDLGDATYLAALAAGADPAPLYADAIAALVLIQSAPRAGLPAYDERLLRFELSLFPDWFLRVHLGLEPPDFLPALDDLLVQGALAQPQVPVHRDFHSRNLMVAEPNPGVLDFQDAVIGAVSYDLVSLLKDAYIEWPAERVDAWIAAYRRAAADAGIDCGSGADEFRRWFDLMGLQRQLKVAGIFARLNHRDGKARYLADIPRTLGYAQAAARRYPETRPLAEWLDAVVRPLLNAKGAR